MNSWVCRNCGKSVTMNTGAKPSGGQCQKDSRGKMKPHNWVKK